jgi:hypothetical protein
MKSLNSRSINTPKNEFLKKKLESFRLNLRMPYEFKEIFQIFRKLTRDQGLEWEDVLGNLIAQFNVGKISFDRTMKSDGEKRK